jgi:micrococcal nuclease
MKDHLYHYRARVVDVYDGDTCTVDIDLGLRTWIHAEKVRLVRIDAPEVKGASRARGLQSRDALRKLILGKEIFLQTIKDRKEKYGRYLGEVWLDQGKQGCLNVNDWMAQKGFAVYKKY